MSLLLALELLLLPPVFLVLVRVLFLALMFLLAPLSLLTPVSLLLADIVLLFAQNSDFPIEVTSHCVEFPETTAKETSIRRGEF